MQNTRNVYFPTVGIYPSHTARWADHSSLKVKIEAILQLNCSKKKHHHTVCSLLRLESVKARSHDKSTLLLSHYSSSACGGGDSLPPPSRPVVFSPKYRIELPTYHI